MSKILSNFALALKKSLPWKFSLYWNIFIIHDFWTTCTCPENIICPENFQSGELPPPRPPPCTPMCMTMHRYHIISASNLCARELCGPIIASHAAIATSRKTCFPQIVLLQYKAKPYLLGFQNLGCHCKILGCHFDTQKRLKKHWTTVELRILSFRVKLFPLKFWWRLNIQTVLLRHSKLR